MIININYDNDITIEEEDLIGEISILSENGSIDETDTFIDSWLFSLIDLYTNFKNGKNVKIDLVEEPAPLIGTILSNGFSIQYGNKKIYFQNLNEFGVALKAASKKVINDFKTSSALTNNEIYKKILEFIY